MSGKTIQIYLPSGDPRSMRIAEVTTRIVRCFEIPRAELNQFLKRPESTQVGVYFLFGESDLGEPLAYLGQTGNLAERLRQHQVSKDFWTRALAVVSLTNNWTQTHATYLEWLCIQAAGKAQRFTLENGNSGSKPFTPEALEADCQEVFETVRFLSTTLGYPLFDALRDHLSKNSNATHETAELDAAPKDEAVVYCCRSKDGADAQGIYTPEGFVVLKGSKARKSLGKSFIENNNRMKEREELLQTKKLTDAGEVLTFTEDVLFSSPSGAAVMVLGRSSNGWDAWLSPEGKTLDAVVRKTVVS